MEVSVVMMTLVLTLLIFNICIETVGGSYVYDVTKFGAKGDGITDDSQNFWRAWVSTCKDISSPTFLIPSGKTFLLKQIMFEGPCNSTIHVQVDGNLLAPNSLWRIVGPNNWITFKQVNDLTIDGNGQIDGHGSQWWKCINRNSCQDAPHALALFYCNNVRVSGIHFVNSAGKHFIVYKSVGVYVSGITVNSPAYSPNTDGIHIQESQQVQVTASNIASGDDCVSIGGGSSDVNISHIACGPGHGISIGSLGMNNTRDEVKQIHVSFCSFVQTTNGARIKTWQGGSGFANEITFEHLTFDSVQNPVIIDQYYCIRSTCPDQPDAVQVSDVKFNELKGTTVSDDPVTLNCSRTVGCTSIVLQDININGAESGVGLVSSCINAHGTMIGTVLPPVPCLRP